MAGRRRARSSEKKTEETNEAQAPEVSSEPSDPVEEPTVELVETSPAPVEAPASAAPAEVSGFPYRVVKGRGVNTHRGVLSSGDRCRDADFPGGAERAARLVEVGVLERV